MSTNIGSIFIKLAAEIADFKNDMQKATRILNDNVSKMQRGLKGLNAALAAVGVGLLVNKLQDLSGQLVKTMDKFNQLQGRVKNSLDSVNEFDSTFKKLIESSNRTGASLDTVAQAFTRLRPAAAELGKTNDDLIRFNETFLKMGSLAGATSEEIGNTMIQLSQGLAAGALRGDELRSVMEQMPMVARTIAESMGIPFSEFKKAAEDGLITSEAVFKAVIGKAEETDIAFSKLPGSVDRSMTRITNSLKLLLDDLNESIGLTDTLSSSMDDLAVSVENYNTKNMDATTSQGNFNLAMVRFGKTGENLWGILVDLWNTVDNLLKTLTGGFGILDVASSLLDGIGIICEGTTALVRGLTGAFAGLTDMIRTLIWDGLDKLPDAFQRAGANIPSLSFLPKPTGGGISPDMLKGYLATGSSTSMLGSGSIFGPQTSIPQSVLSSFKYTGRGSKNNRTAGGKGKSSKGSKGRTGKSDLEREMDRLKSQAESLRDSVRKPWEIFNEGVAEADKLLKMHLISLETYNRVVDDLGKKTDDMIKVEGLDQAMEAFMAPIEKGADSVLEDFATGLDKIKDSVSRQQDVLKSIETPQEKYLNQVGEISQLFNDGWLSIDQYTLALDNLNKEGQDSLGDLESAIFSMGTAFEQSFMQFTQTGKFAFKDMITSMLQDLSRLIFQMTVIQPLFGGAKANGGKGGIFTNLISSALGGLFGGGSKVKLYNQPFGPAFANGGQTPANQPFMVGERGPEIMSFDRPAYVTPNHKLGDMSGGGSVVVNQTINISTGVQSTVRAELAQMMPEIRRQSQNSVMEAISRGGRMSKAVGAKA